MWRLDDIDAAQVEAVARGHAHQLGLRPRTRLRYDRDWDQFTVHARNLQPVRSDRTVRGMCARGHTAGLRCIWVADQPHRGHVLETLTHEIAHALIPWRERHTARWLQLHLATLASLSSPSHTAAVQDLAAIQYGIILAAPSRVAVAPSRVGQMVTSGFVTY